MYCNGSHWNYTQDACKSKTESFVGISDIKFYSKIVKIRSSSVISCKVDLNNSGYIFILKNSVTVERFVSCILVVHCPIWDSIKNGDLIGEGNVYSSTAEITCDYGYAVKYERDAGDVMAIEGDIGDYLRSLIVYNVTLTCSKTKEWVDMDGNVVTPALANTVCQRKYMYTVYVYHIIFS